MAVTPMGDVLTSVVVFLLGTRGSYGEKTQLCCAMGAAAGLENTSNPSGAEVKAPQR